MCFFFPKQMIFGKIAYKNHYVFVLNSKLKWHLFAILQMHYKIVLKGSFVIFIAIYTVSVDTDLRSKTSIRTKLQLRIKLLRWSKSSVRLSGNESPKSIVCSN